MTKQPRTRPSLVFGVILSVGMVACQGSDPKEHEGTAVSFALASPTGTSLETDIPNLGLVEQEVEVIV